MGQMNHTLLRRTLLIRLRRLVETATNRATGSHVIEMPRDPRRNRRIEVCGLPKLFVGVFLLVSFSVVGCKRAPLTVAVIPRTSGTALWEPEHAGAAAVARS